MTDTNTNLDPQAVHDECVIHARRLLRRLDDPSKADDVLTGILDAVRQDLPRQKAEAMLEARITEIPQPTKPDTITVYMWKNDETDAPPFAVGRTPEEAWDKHLRDIASTHLDELRVGLTPSEVLSDYNSALEKHHLDAELIRIDLPRSEAGVSAVEAMTYGHTQIAADLRKWISEEPEQRSTLTIYEVEDTKRSSLLGDVLNAACRLDTEGLEALQSWLSNEAREDLVTVHLVMGAHMIQGFGATPEKAWADAERWLTKTWPELEEPKKPREDFMRSMLAEAWETSVAVPGNGLGHDMLIDMADRDGSPALLEALGLEGTDDDTTERERVREAWWSPEMPEPEVTIKHGNPTERVTVWVMRDADMFFAARTALDAWRQALDLAVRSYTNREDAGVTPSDNVRQEWTSLALLRVEVSPDALQEAASTLGIDGNHLAVLRDAVQELADEGGAS